MIHHHQLTRNRPGLGQLKPSNRCPPPVDEESPTREHTPASDRQVHGEHSANQPDTGGAESDWGTVTIHLETLRTILKETILENHKKPDF